MSPRAAWRLEALGFSDVYNYPEGKLDWLAAGLPVEGRSVQRARAGDVARGDVPTCAVDDRLGDVAERVRAAGFDACAVINDERVVFGLLRASHLEGNPEQAVADAMDSAPSTFRPHVPAAHLGHYLGEHELESALITSSDGRLIGLLLREDAERVAHEEHDDEV